MASLSPVPHAFSAAAAFEARPCFLNVRYLLDPDPIDERQDFRGDTKRDGVEQTQL
jgi:hypothetical protein